MYSVVFTFILLNTVVAIDIAPSLNCNLRSSLKNTVAIRLNSTGLYDCTCIIDTWLTRDVGATTLSTGNFSKCILDTIVINPQLAKPVPPASVQAPQNFVQRPSLLKPAGPSGCLSYINEIFISPLSYRELNDARFKPSDCKCLLNNFRFASLNPKVKVNYSICDEKVGMGTITSTVARPSSNCALVNSFCISYKSYTVQVIEYATMSPFQMSKDCASRCCYSTSNLLPSGCS